ncbi:MAG: 2-dehydro-3-deoxy-D-gluconate 5-dehydrogenase KduD [Hyphomonas sp.]|uniref:2-dehydro-3-deoxy-D-gluconate 5-dehydrogenase KduD n=1 Tax=Hyphomonas sp. TaxID=87 RepID=UPI0017EC2408|nr:2-dehydro-3-deoxy-D-gluconate 5-dehydrogenase KduD [Hyphomonas sp.]MBU3922353.1 2-dehydro-3-deoxy-D-gluconate 5-dehydrogenase KduD [Alphaproteobacteria bacterium]MBA3069937.1 2-dehydro-3-deoxy-D-gluconate 5-dehydrogenase KduD [Hyphomonas sp.]MBU4060487.1 2-dehydro-3-deoxy-D-gluconate 5-dehydrogenase KduD [Alphaproteobacteria bacterium]MBU4163155.1 2-dehydro-3-deoxy-D-gluconate 5-dehydrogenase KduD [Alphaproteobacteria bacterium]MBU4568114.1 2-dehydro-3-deoxy-D-gluconate 5-dehydrogenase KduD
MSSAFDLTGKVALVTGANTGLGQGLAVGLAAAGADIVAAGRSTPAETEAAVLALGRKFAFVPADFSRPSMAGDVAAKAETPFGPISILVNNAGTIKRNDALDFTESDWDEVMDVNLKSVFFLSQAVARSMVAGGDGGKIINIASMLSFQGGIRVASYTASKSGVAGLTKLLANEWAKHGINVNAIAPGYFATNNTDALRADEKRNIEILGRIPAGRWGQPSDLAGAAVFLASGASDYVHGTILAVDGGWLAR